VTIEVRGKAPNFNGHLVRLAKNSFISPIFRDFEMVLKKIEKYGFHQFHNFFTRHSLVKKL
jgi:hypothetical protein